MSKISDLPLLTDPDGSEAVVAIRDGVTGQSALAPMVELAAQPVLQQMLQIAAYAEAFRGPVVTNQQDGENATDAGQIYQIVNPDGSLSPKLRTTDGSVSLQTLASSLALASNIGAALLGAADGSTVQDNLDTRLIRISSRANLAKFAQTTQLAYLTEPGREGTFRWEPSDHSSQIVADPAQGICVAAISDRSGSNGTWKRVFEHEINIRWFGAKFDVANHLNAEAASDDTSAWEAALSYLGFISGGTLLLPHGASKVTRQITVDQDRIRIRGTGTRKVYPGVHFVPGQNCPSTLVPVHSGRNAIRFVGVNQGDGSFQCSDFSLATLESGPKPVAAFGWDASPAFLYGYTFERVAVHGFTSGFDVYRSQAGGSEIGAVLISDCVINHNEWIVRTLDGTQFNGFRFVYNKAGQNGYLLGQGGIAISGHNVAINDNILEGMRDAVKIFGSFRDICVKGNYFESNVGRACIELASIIGPFDVGPNNFGLLDYSKLDHKVLLRFTGLGKCVDPYWSEAVNKMSLPLLGNTPAARLNNNVRSGEYGYFRADRLDDANFAEQPQVVAMMQHRVSSPVREIHPLTGNPFPVDEYSSSGPGFAPYSYPIGEAAGQWAVMSWLFKRMPDGAGAADPYFSMSVNGNGAPGSRDYIPFNYNQHWQDGEWCLVTSAIKLEAAMSSLLLLLYPHGPNPAANRRTRYLPPLVYTVADINQVRPFTDQPFSRTVPAAPTTGPWQAGDKLPLAAPDVGASFVFCKAAGTPGTWATG